MRRNMRHPSPSFHLPFFPFSPLFFPFNAWPRWLAGAFRGQIQYVCLLNAVHIGAREGGPDIDPKGASGDQIMHPSNSTSTRRTIALVDCAMRGGHYFTADAIHHVSLLPRCPAVRGATLTPSIVHSFTSTYSLAARDVSHRSSAGLPGDDEVDATCTLRSARNTEK